MFLGPGGLELSSHEIRQFSQWYAEKLQPPALRCTLSLYSPHMASVERKQEKQGPFYLGYGSRRQTSAEIVTEARNSLRTLRTQRPFTPQEEQRQLFGGSARTRDGRPPSSFRFWRNKILKFAPLVLLNIYESTQKDFLYFPTAFMLGILKHLIPDQIQRPASHLWNV